MSEPFNQETEQPDGSFAPDPELAGDLEADLKKLQDERESLFQQLARVQADFRNARQRLESEKQSQIQYANASLIKAMLPTIDNFERALEQDPAKAESAALLKGMRIIHDQLIDLLRAQHVRVIAPDQGEAFNPHEHEALMQRPDDRYREPAVVQLFQKGYALHDRVLRPAQVAVSRPTNQCPPPSDDQQRTPSGEL